MNLRNAMLLLAVSLAAAGCFAGDAKRTLKLGDLERTYTVFVPDGEAPANGFPCVLVLHGGGGDGAGMVKFTKFSVLAAKERFVVVYPDGYKKNWNDGRTVPKSAAHSENLDDAGFIGKVLDDVGQLTKLDPARIFATGISNGGCFSHYLGAKLAHRLAAIAPVCGGIADPFPGDFKPASPVSVLMLQGTADPLMPYSGGGGADGRRGDVLSTDAAVKLWVGINGCGAEPQVTNLEDADPKDGCKVVVSRWTNGLAGTEVVLYRIEGGGHTWPGGLQYLPARLIGPVCRDFDATAVIWDFFKAHPKATAHAQP